MNNMYNAVAFSPLTILTQAATATDTVLRVESIVGFPPAPNYATIDNKETVRYSQIGEGVLSGCERGIEGEACAHTAGCKLARLFTAKDYNQIIENITQINTALTSEITARSQGDTATLDTAKNYTDSAVAEVMSLVDATNTILQNRLEGV